LHTADGPSRSAYAIVADLAQAGYVIKQKDGRCNWYQIEAHLPLPEPGTREPAISEVLALLLGNPGNRDGLPMLPPRAGQTAWTAQMSPPPGPAQAQGMAGDEAPP
jgi:hypothetical protein